MGKHILLIGVSAGELAVESSASTAIANVIALKKALLTEVQELREDQVTTLINPKLKQLRHAIVLMSYRCRRDDLCLIYYTGCGTIDPQGKIHLAAGDTKLDRIAATSVSGDYISQTLPTAKQGLNQVLILDCLWGAQPTEGPVEAAVGAEAAMDQPLPPPSEPPLALPHLNTDHCALLTALGSTGNPWPTTDSGLSLYTHTLIEGLTTGLADTDADGSLSVNDLHRYLNQALTEDQDRADILPLAHYASGESAHQPLLPVQPYSPEREYRRSVEDYAHRYRGQIPPASRNILEFLRHQLGISIDQSQAIEQEIMQPYASRQDSCDRYRHALETVLQLESPLGKPLKKWLRYLQGQLDLSYDEVCAIEAQVMAQATPYQQLQPLPQVLPAHGEPRLQLPAHAIGALQNGHHASEP